MKRSLLLLALVAPVAWACGVCVEDKVAATYDYAVVQRALAHRQVVVYCEVSGHPEDGRLRQAAAKVPALDRESLRISVEPAALSFALDPARQSPKAAVAALQRAMPAGTHVHMIRVATAQGLQAATR